MIRLRQLFSSIPSMGVDHLREFMASHHEGTYTLLDVRQPEEYEQEHIPGGLLIPMPALSDSLDNLDRSKPVITYCAAGGRSRGATQLLLGNGFREVYSLEGGIRAWNGAKAEGPRELHMEHIRGDEEPHEVLRLAYGMEMALGRFYGAMGDRTADDEAVRLFSRLAQMEERHKNRIFELYQDTISTPVEQTAFETDATTTLMEGGFEIDRFMTDNKDHMQAIPDILNVAMMVETQALDLYMRFAHASGNEQTKTVLFSIADEEKTHLSALGALLGRAV